MGAARDIPVYRCIGRPGQNSDGVTGKSGSWLVGTGTYRTRTSNNGAGTARGSYFNAGETWYGIIASRVSSTGGYPARSYNWHDEAVSGYSWGGVSPLAFDCFVPGSSDFDSRPTINDTVYVLEDAGSCPGLTGGAPTAHTHLGITPYPTDSYVFHFIKVNFSTSCTGSLEVWVQETGSSLSDSPVINLTNVRTLNPATGWFPGVQFWQGFYRLGFTSGANIQIDHMLSMWGQSWQQAWDDVPSLVQFVDTSAGSVTGSYSLLSSINTNDFPIPTDIVSQLSDPPGGGGGGGGGGGAGGSVSIVNTGSPVYYNATSQTQSITLAASADLLVLRHVNTDNQDVVTGVTYNGSALTKLDSQVDAAGVGYAAAWYLKAPSTGAAHNLVITLAGGSHRCEYDYLALSGVDQTSPFGTVGKTNGHGTSLTRTISSGVGDLVIDLGFLYQDSAPSVSATATGQTQDSDTAHSTSSFDPFLITSHMNGAASVVPTWTVTSAHYYAYMAVNVVAAAGAAGVPVNSLAPSISGTKTVGQTLTTAHGTWTNTPTSYTYQWTREFPGASSYTNISGATASTYVLVDIDDGCTIECVVSATNATGDGVPVTTAATSAVVEPTPANTIAPEISGIGLVGQELVIASTGQWTGMAGYNAAFTYQWQRDAVDILGATAPGYTTVEADLTHALSCNVTATNTGDTATAASNELVITTATIFQDSYYSLLTNLLFWYSPVDGNLYSDTGGSLANVKTFTAGSRVSLVDFAGAVYVTHPVDGLFSSTDGTNWSAVTKGTHTAGIPKGSLIAVWQTKLWISGDPAASDRVYFSAPGDATDWDSGDAGGSVDVREKDDAPVVALHGGSGIDFQTDPGLFVFKHDSVFRILDSTNGSFIAIDGSIGAASKNSVTSLYGELVFISRRGIYQTKKLAAVIPAAEQVLPLFDPASTDDSYLDNFCAGYLGDRVYFSITLQGSTVNNLALEYAPLYGWAVAGSNAMACYQTKTGTSAEILLAASPTVAGQIYKMATGGADDGADIASYYETRWFEVESGHQARMNVARVLFRGQIDLKLYSDFSTVPSWSGTLNSTSAGLTWGQDNWGVGIWGGSEVESYDTLYPRKVARAFKFRIEETSSQTYSRAALLESGATLETGAWALYSVETQYTPLGLS